MNRTIEIELDEVNDVEAHVFARYSESPAAGEAPREEITLEGAVQGPFCATARTLPAEYRFRAVGKHSPGVVKAIIPDPCLWSPDVPHLYHVDIRALRQGQTVANYRGDIGLRRRSPRRQGIEFPG